MDNIYLSVFSGLSFYGSGLLSGLVIGMRWVARCNARIADLEGEVEAAHDQINRYLEHPDEFAHDVELVRQVCASPTFGVFGRVVEDKPSLN